MPRIKDASIFSDFGKLIKVTVIYSFIYRHRREYFFSIISTFIEIKKNNKKKPPKKQADFSFFLFLISQTQDLCWDFFVE